ncbi:hypothetical protein [Kutzneria sp. CA-103260]|uniref:hypothetical protein n=1 Tax=Kutzneria sp. CA-103260 TaxID=2802641 RepID=UPI001BADBD28|nr:hypothetical protein [Kutzneria sp. CA-103260]
MATKIASSGGLAGTLLGTLIPLLPQYLPLLLVGFIVARRPMLAVVAFGAMILLTPTNLTWNSWWQALWGQTLRLGSDLQHFEESLVHHLDNLRQGQFAWSRAYPFMTRHLVDIFHHWPLWVATLAFICGIASAPARLRRIDDAELKKMIADQLKDLEEGWSDEIRVGTTVIKPPERELTNRGLLEDWRKNQRNTLLTVCRALRKRRPRWRAVYGLQCSLLAIPLVGLILQCYTIPIEGVDLSRAVRSVWLPPESLNVKVDGKPQSIVGYVLSTSDKWYVVLTESDRTIDYIKADDVTTRSVCSLNKGQIQSGAPLINLAGTTTAASTLCPAG